MSNFAKLKELCSKIGSGATPTGGEDSYKKQGLSLIRSQNVQDLYFIKKGLAYIDAEQAKKLNNVEVKENDVLLNITGDSIARACMVPKEILPARVNQHVSIIRVNEKIDGKYLLYYLIFRKEYLLTICRVGGTRNALTKEAIENIDIRIDKNDKKIAAVLSALDDKIELNNKINAELEAMAKTLYDYWFVQFDFPDEEGKPYKSSGGKMAYNEVLKREIPEGWEVKSLAQIEGNIITGKTPPTNDNSNFDGNVPFITIDDIRQNLFVVRTGKTLSRKGADSQGNKFIPSGSICVTCIATPGLVGFTSNEAQTNQQINSIIIKKEFNRYYLYFAILNYFKFSKGAKTGNTFANMNKGDFENISLINPLPEIKKLFTAKVDCLFKCLHNNLKQNQELASLRDWLLPMLMNGQVKVGDSDQRVISNQAQSKGKKQVPVNSAQLEMLF